MLLIQVETEYIHASDHDTTAFTFFIKIGISKISQIPRHLGNFPDTQAFGKFPKWLDIWGIYQKPRHLGNSPNVWVFGEFPVIWEISKILKIYHPQIPIETWGISKIPRHLGNSPNSQTFEELPKCLGFGKFPKYPVIWEISKILKIYHPQIPIEIWGISQMPGYLGNFPTA